MTKVSGNVTQMISWLSVGRWKSAFGMLGNSSGLTVLWLVILSLVAHGMTHTDTSGG
uniref:Holin n=1 Tax=Pseudomonas phage KV2023 TaxID=3234047 RepID=A0AB39C6Z6_9CAUD